MPNEMTQGSIDKIYRHAGKLAKMMELVSSAHHALEDLDVNKLMFIGEDLAELYSPDFCNDCGDIFKQFYNRQRKY